jgi:cytochrome c peroxidase
MDSTGCTGCHVANLQINRDRRVADVETAFDPANGIMNRLFATAKPLIIMFDDLTGMPAMKLPTMQPFVVNNIFTDFKRHDLGPNFHERNYDGTTQELFLTTALWGVATTAPYGHDGRSNTLHEVILRHGGEAQLARDNYASLSPSDQRDLLDFLGSLVLFPPDDTASNLDAGSPSVLGFPQVGHGSIKLTVLFNDPMDIE